MCEEGEREREKSGNSKCRMTNPTSMHAFNMYKKNYLSMRFSDRTQSIELDDFPILQQFSQYLDRYEPAF